MGGTLKYIVILGLGFLLGYQFTSQGKRVSSSIEAGMASKSFVTKQLDQILSEGEPKKIVEKRSFEEFRDQEPKPDLSAYSFYDLSLALKNKRKKYEDENTKLYDINFEDKDEYKQAQEKALDHLSPFAEVSLYWQAQGELSLDGESVPLFLTLDFYSYESDSDQEIDFSKLKKPSLCWFTALYFEYKDKKNRTSTSSCALTTRKNNEYYMTVNEIENSTLNKFLYYLMIPFPDSSAQLEYMIPGDKNWQKGSSLSWTAISKEDFDKATEAYKDYKWAH